MGLVTIVGTIVRFKLGQCHKSMSRDLPFNTVSVIYLLNPLNDFH